MDKFLTYICRKINRQTILMVLMAGGLYSCARKIAKLEDRIEELEDSKTEGESE